MFHKMNCCDVEAPLLAFCDGIKVVARSSLIDVAKLACSSRRANVDGERIANSFQNEERLFTSACRLLTWVGKELN